MKPQRCVDYLSSLRQEIAALQIVQCRMSHERVVSVADSMLPIVDALPEGSYQRVGLCSPEARVVSLGCSHTTARIKLESAIEAVATNSGDRCGPQTSFGSELNWLDNEIHLLDHRKGEAEKVLAGILAEVTGADSGARECERLRAAEEEVREMERLHDEYVERIGALRDRIIAELDKLIERVDMELR